MSYEKRIIELAAVRHYIVPNWFYGIVKEADATIAALTERLRIVEAERDAELSAAIEANVCPACYAKMKDADAQLSALRAELRRKDAALWRAGLALHHCEGELSAIGSRGTVDANNVKNFSAEARAAIRWVEEAIQPKEPPCQTA